MVTMGVKDAAAKDPSAKTYTIVGYGSMDGLVKLDPPRSKKSRFAIIVVWKTPRYKCRLQNILNMMNPQKQLNASGLYVCSVRM